MRVCDTGMGVKESNSTARGDGSICLAGTNPRVSKQTIAQQDELIPLNEKKYATFHAENRSVAFE